METLLRRLGVAVVDYVKMDIEGAEQELLEDGSAVDWSSRVRALNVEVHPPYSVGKCRDRLEQLGFATSPHRSRPTALLAVRRDG